MKRKFRASFNDFHIDSSTGLHHTASGDLKLPAKELAVLATLIQNAGKLVLKEEIVRAVWGDYSASDSSIARCISSIKSYLRKASPQADACIEMIYGRGYRFVGNVTSSAFFLCEESFAKLINTSPDFILFKDDEGRWVYANTAALQAFDLNEREWHNKTDAQLAEFLPTRYRTTLANCAQSDLTAWQQKTPSKSSEIVPLADGSQRNYDMIKLPLFHPDGSRNILIVFGRDISDLLHAIDERNHTQQEFEQRLASIQFLAYHDSLTQLPNRTLLKDRFQQARASARRRNKLLAVLFLDLDGFKSINDQFGRRSG